MFPTLLLGCVVCNKVYRKSNPNGKLTLYLEKRSFSDGPNETEPVEGVVVVDGDFIQGRKIYGQLSTIYRYGREEDEVMGLKFTKEFILKRDEIAPVASESLDNLTPIQERLMRKYPGNAFPFTFRFPVNAPNSVTLQPGGCTSRKSLGVFYAVKCMVGDEVDAADEEMTVTLIVKKLRYAFAPKSTTSPKSVVSKYFSFGSGKLDLEVSLDKEVYYHGESVGVNVFITNSSRRSVKDIKCYAVQHCEVTMIGARYWKCVASLETRDGCPVIPGNSFTTTFLLLPVAFINRNKFGVALDGYLKGEEVSLASSTFEVKGNDSEDALGIVVSYSVRVKLNYGTLGGELVADVPFKLVHPIPGSEEEHKVKRLIAAKSIDKAYYEKVCSAFYDDEFCEEGSIPLRNIRRQKTVEIDE